MKFHGCHCHLLLFLLNFFFEGQTVVAIRKYTRQDLLKLREEVRELFDHAYTGYLKYAYPYDELRPLTCDGVDTWGSYSLTLIDALDTLAVMGNYSEFRRVVNLVTANANFDANINVSVFETNIRIVGGLLSAHLLSQRAGIDVEPGWPCNGPLLRLAEDVAKRLLAAFRTETGMPYGTVNLRYGVPPGETTVTCTAGVGTFILEFATLSRLTGDPIYEEVAMNALKAMYNHRSSIGLFGNHIDVQTGKWVARDSGIGAGVDSYFEYMVKGALLLGQPELMAMFNDVRRPIDKYLRKNHWYVWASMSKGQVTLPVFQSLDAYWPGVLALIGDVETALRTMHNYNSVWKQYGFTPEFYNIAQGQAGTNRESYPLRPELAESAMYVYRATSDPFMLDIGLNILRSIQHSARTTCGYATIKDSRDHTLENRMESFFLAETTKYLYLLFDPDNFIHNTGSHGRLHVLPSGKQCILDSGAYVFNTEAHPFDAAALECCHDWSHKSLSGSNYDFKGENLSKAKGKRGNLNGRKDQRVTPLPPVEEEVEAAVPATKDESEDAFKEIRDDLLSLKDSLNKLVDKMVKMNHSQIVEDWDKKRGPSVEDKSKEPRQKTDNSTIQPEQSEPTFQHSQHHLIVNVENGSGTTTTTTTPPTNNGEEDDETGDDSRPQLIGHSQVMTLPEYVKALVATPLSNPKFDPQELLQLVRTTAKARPLNDTWSTQYELLTCRAQPFLIRITIAGEFLEEK